MWRGVRSAALEERAGRSLRSGAVRLEEEGSGDASGADPRAQAFENRPEKIISG
jgi:hypothetical protein